MAEKASAKVLDMTDVEEEGARFNKKRVREGDYLARVIQVQDAKSKKDGAFQWLFTISLEEHQSTRYPYYCKHQLNQLWKIRNLMIAAGMVVPKKKIKLDPERLVGKLIAVTMEDDEYEGKLQSVIGAVFPPSEMQSNGDDDEEDVDEDEEDEDEDEEEPTPPKRKKAAPVVDDDEDDEDEEDEEPAPPPRRRKKKAAPVVEDDEDHEDEEPAPKKKKKSKKTVTDEELEELDIDDV